MRIRQLNHSVYQIQYHLVWGTKYRRKFLKYYVRSALIKSLYKAQRKFPDWYLDQINTGDDHVHILLEIPPKYALASVVQYLKSSTNTSLKKQFRFIREIYDSNSIWSTGYFVSTVGLNEQQIRRYIERQNNYDRSLDITAEFS